MNKKLKLVTLLIPFSFGNAQALVEIIENQFIEVKQESPQIPLKIKLQEKYAILPEELIIPKPKYTRCKKPFGEHNNSRYTQKHYVKNHNIPKNVNFGFKENKKLTSQKINYNTNSNNSRSSLFYKNKNKHPTLFS